MTTARGISQSDTVEPSFNIDELATVPQARADLDRDSTARSVAMASGGHAERSEHRRIHSESAGRTAELLRAQLAGLG